MSSKKNIKKNKIKKCPEELSDKERKKLKSLALLDDEYDDIILRYYQQ